MRVKLFLITLFLLCFAACEDDGKDISNQGASVLITVTDADGKPVAGETVNMYADKFPNAFFHTTFFDNETDNYDNNFISSEKTDVNGIASFGIDGKQMSGYERTFYFSCVNSNSYAEITLRNGETKVISLPTFSTQDDY